MNQYPHMCRDEHEEIGHANSDDDERCPLCRVRDALEECHNWLAQRVIDIIPEIDKPATEARINMARAVLDGSDSARSEKDQKNA